MPQFPFAGIVTERTPHEVYHIHVWRREPSEGRNVAFWRRAQEKFGYCRAANALEHPFFSQPPPKSAGREQFGQDFVARYFLSRRRARFEDLLRTSLELTARAIAGALARFVFPSVKIHRLIVSGGGAHNRLLVKRLAELLPHLTVELSDRYGLPVDAKEAIAFAILADRTLHGLPGNLPSVTGARRAVVLGKIVRP